MLIVVSVSTIVFNINALMRCDGYYILSDLPDIPNLRSRASGHLRHLIERHGFGHRKSESPAENPSEATWFTYSDYPALCTNSKSSVRSSSLLQIASCWSASSRRPSPCTVARIRGGTARWSYPLGLWPNPFLRSSERGFQSSSKSTTGFPALIRNRRSP